MTTLKQNTNKIKTLEAKGSISASEIATIVGELAETKAFKESYGTAEQYAKDCLEWSRSNWNQYVGLHKVQQVLGVPVRMEVSRVIKPLIVGKTADVEFISKYLELHQTEAPKDTTGMLTTAIVEDILPETKKQDKPTVEKLLQAYKNAEMIIQSGIKKGDLSKDEVKSLLGAHSTALKALFKGK